LCLADKKITLLMNMGAKSSDGISKTTCFIPFPAVAKRARKKMKYFE